MKQLIYSSNLGSSLIPTFATSMQSLRPGDILLNEGDECAGRHWRIVQGVLKVKRVYRSGLFLETLLGPGEELVAPHGKSEFQLQAASALVVETLSFADSRPIGGSVVPSHPIRATSLGRTGASMALSGILAPYHSNLKRPVELMPVRSRVAAIVWALGRRFGAPQLPSRPDGGTAPKLQRAGGESQAIEINLDLTREELGHLAGTVYESVIRSLTSLKKDGVLALEGRSISILREDQLARVGQIVLPSAPQEADPYEEQKRAKQNDDLKNHSTKINTAAKEAG